MSLKDDNYKKIHFRLEKDEDGYPPDDWESVWAEEVEPGLYRLDNIPFFIRGVSCGDLISANLVGDELHFGQIVHASGNSVLRVVVSDETAVGDLRTELRAMGCETELCDIPGFISIEVPAEINIQPVLDFLANGEKKEDWEYEEASIRHV